MKKSLINKVVILTMISFIGASLFLIPVSASADVIINSETELITTIDAADANPTVVIVGSDLVLSQTISIPDGKNIVFTTSDTVVKTITYQGSNTMFRVASGASLTLNGSIDYDAQNRATVNSIINCKGKLVINSGTFKNVYNDTGFTGVLVLDGVDAQLTMNGGTIRDSMFDNQYCGSIVIRNGAMFVLNDGVITNNIANNINSAGGVLVYSSYTNATAQNNYISTFVMEGGEISKNTSTGGGGVHLIGGNPYSGDFYSRSLLTMNGGQITGNTSTSTITGGGGVYVELGAEFTQNGGNISYNKSHGVGGGVATYDGYVSFYGKTATYENAWDSWYPAAFTMNGGAIVNNSVEGTNAGMDRGCGGGVYVGSNWVTLKAGEIRNNNASLQGGGVYVGSVPYTLNINDATVTNNEAAIGGGVWFCPTGSAQINLTNGVAIYQNKATTMGDDFVSETKEEGHDYVVNLNNRMLGGGLVEWYRDAQNNRYSESNQELLEEIYDVVDDVQLKAKPLVKAIERAQVETKLFITDNQANGTGGGIGCNGNINFGIKDLEHKVTITKKWVLGNATSDVLPKEITVHLLENGTVVATKKLNEQNQWHTTFTGLKVYNDPTKVYTVVEETIPGFSTSYDEPDMINNEILITITNTYQSITILPKEPEQSGKVEREIVVKRSNIIDTSDMVDSAIWAYLGILSGVAITISILLKRNKANMIKRLKFK